MTRQETPAGDVISAEGLCMRYRTKDVLREVSLRVGRGETVALLGPNGAGKITTVEVLEGFRRPSAGQVRVLDASPLTADRRWRARTGIAAQSWPGPRPVARPGVPGLPGLLLPCGPTR